MTRLRVGLIGPGGIADANLAPAITASDSLRLWSVLSRDPGRAAAFATKHAAAAPRPAHTDLAAMLADPDLDAVVIASPDKLHAAQAIAAAAAGKHVLVEKPMASSPEDARAMVAAARDAGVTLGVAYHLRWHAGHRALAERIRAGALGTLLHARVLWTWQARDASNWRAHDAVGRWWGLGGVGTHGLDLARWMLREAGGAGEVDDVASVIGRPRWKTGHDETAVVALRFASGATAEIVSSVVFRSTPRLELYGSTCAAICDGTLGPHGGGSITIDGVPVPFTQVDPYLGELEDFARAVRERGRCAVPGDEGARNVEILAQAAP